MRTGLGSDDADDGDKKERDRRTTDMAFEIIEVSIHPYQVERIGSGSRKATDRQPIRRNEP